jgi:hypothetical protein
MEAEAFETRFGGEQDESDADEPAPAADSPAVEDSD